METYNKKHLNIILKDAIISQCDHNSIVRIIPHIQEMRFKKSGVIYRKGASPDHLYFVVSGKVLLKGRKTSITIHEGRFGEESAVSSISGYITDAIAQSPVTVLAVPKEYVTMLVSIKSEMESIFSRELITRFSREQVAVPKIIEREKKTEPLSKRKITGWWLLVIFSVLTLFIAKKFGVSNTIALFLTIMAATVTMWIFDLVAEFVPGLFAVAAVLILNLVPVDVALSGFASESFFMALSILALGIVIVSSGLSYRIILNILRIVPNNQFWHNIGIIVVGFFLTPILPSINGRVALVSPLLVDMVESLNLKKKEKAADRLALSAFTGTTLLSPIFLSSKSVNFIIFGLISLQLQEEYQWLGWFRAAAVTGFVLILLYALSISILYRNSEMPRLSKDMIRLQVDTLGPISTGEWAGILGVVIFSVAIFTSSLHRIPPSWLGMAMLYLLILFGILRRDQFRRQVDWPFLMFLGGMISVCNIMNFLGVNKILAEKLSIMGVYMHTNFGLFILILMGTIFIIRLFIPISVSIVLCATVFIPIASAFGINEWLIGFIILIIGEMWYFPYQCSYYLNFVGILKETGIYTEATFLRYNALHNILKLLAIYASIPYWKLIGVL